VNLFLVTSLILVAILIAVGLYRVWAGPTVFDRLIAVALVSVNGVVVLVILGFVLERPSLFIDIALGFALLAFLLPIALGRYFEARDDGTSRDGSPSPSGHANPRGTVPHGRLAERGRAATRRSRTPRKPRSNDDVGPTPADPTDDAHGPDDGPTGGRP
jgi:multicomponent Na+:H+ antiporter subunit F